MTFSDGRRAQFDLVVGADGIHSAIRQVIFPGFEPIYRSFCAWRTVMECPDNDRVFTIRSMPGTVLGSFQVAPQLVYAFLLVHAAEIPSLSRAQHLARFKELASSFHGPIPTLIQEQRDPNSRRVRPRVRGGDSLLSPGPRGSHRRRGPCLPAALGSRCRHGHRGCRHAGRADRHEQRPRPGPAQLRGHTATTSGHDTRRGSPSYRCQRLRGARNTRAVGATSAGLLRLT